MASETKRNRRNTLERKCLGKAFKRLVNSPKGVFKMLEKVKRAVIRIAVAPTRNCVVQAGKKTLAHASFFWANATNCGDLARVGSQPESAGVVAGCHPNLYS